MDALTSSLDYELLDTNQQAGDSDQLFLELYSKEFLYFEFIPIAKDKGQAIINVHQDVTALFIELALQDQQKILRPSGIDQQNVTHAFIKEHYTNSIINHLKEFLLKFCVIDFLYQQLEKNKISFGGNPILHSCSLIHNSKAQYVFDLYLTEEISIGEWKLFPFKAPKRKNYKDLDKQVEYFIAEELANAEKSTADTVCLHDWILFSLTPLVQDEQPLAKSLTTLYWFKMADEEIESPLKELFLGKKVHSTMITHNQGLQNFLSNSLVSDYGFKVTIIAIVQHQYVCFNQLKSFFKIKTQKDLHKKLIEIFSYRNDISQRRATVEEALKILMNKHIFSISDQLVSIEKNEILSSIKQISDYNVYKRQADFNTRVHELAFKHAHEKVLIDQIIYNEKITVNLQDMKDYLNLTKRPRLKDFLYFDLPKTELDGQQIPISLQQLKKYCAREKAINYIIYHLTKK
ncbi:hypothetical protein EKK58_02820 [Candidatus Dependentiae bacterium]|nr:MAG: hypothetical protein EKK58_02820 [Candidatus Dependentiae bacterium]